MKRSLFTVALTTSVVALVLLSQSLAAPMPDDVPKQKASDHKAARPAVVEYDPEEVERSRSSNQVFRMPPVEVDLIEFNREEVAEFDQLIFWSKYPDGKLHVRKWTLLTPVVGKRGERIRKRIRKSE